MIIVHPVGKEGVQRPTRVFLKRISLGLAHSKELIVKNHQSQSWIPQSQDVNEV